MGLLADDESRSFPWVYWNPEVKDFTVFNLDPLEMVACKFLLSLPTGLPKKKNDFSCRWILDHNDFEVAQFFDSLLEVQMKQNRLDKLKAQLANTSKMGLRSILLVSTPVTIPAVVPSAAGGASSSTDAAASLKKVPPGTICLDAEENVKEDPQADLRRKRQKRKQTESDATDRVLGKDSAWEHDVHPVDLGFPDNFDYRKAIDGWGSFILCSPGSCEDAFGTVGLEGTLSSKLKIEKELTATQDQIAVLTVERDSALAYLPLKKEVDPLKDQLSEKEGERQSALDRVNQLEEDIKVLNTQLVSYQLSLEKEQKRVEASVNDVRALNASLMEKQTALSTTTTSAEYWEAEWKKSGDETMDMCQETLETVLDQVTHLSLRIDFSVITLDTRWDRKTRRIVDRKKAADEDLELVDDPPHADAVSLEQRPEESEQVQQAQQSEPRSVAGGGGECPT
ncbi:hypothetical protein PIB30_010471 [Stylosanthes scabra]|uniref:Uncharacterized protein n=1 Tax=Stylosanthes scabra TaxID=79078 RepID=A0ABU6Z2J5_9FABA|nr:hypothetical protein [Stylosanthes scabra]